MSSHHVRKSSVRQKHAVSKPRTTPVVPPTPHPSPSSSSSRPSRALSSKPSHMGISSSAIRGKSGNYSVALGKRKLGFGLRVSGSEYIGAVVVPTTEDTDSIYFQRTNPAGPNNTRLRNFATIYERWHAVRYTYRFTSSLPTSTPGTLCFAQDPDPTAVYTSDVAGNIARLRCLPGSSLIQCWQNTNCNLPPTADYTSLWTVDNNTDTVTDADRLDLAGQLIVACAASTGLPAGQVIGILELDYEIEFYSPKLFAGALDRATEFLFPGPTTGPPPPFATSSPSLMDTIVSAIKTAFPTLLSTAVTHVLRDYRPGFSPSLLATPSFSDDRFGFPVGVYRVTFTMASNDTAAMTQYMFFPNTLPYNYNVEFGDGSNSLVAPDRYLGWRSPSGNTYLYADSYTFEFGVNSGRGLRSLAWHRNTLAPASTVDVFISMATAGTSTYFNAGSTSPGVPVAKPKVPKPPPPPEGKERKCEEPESDDDEVMVKTVTSTPRLPAPPTFPASILPAAPPAPPLARHAYAAPRVPTLPTPSS